jgi:hypothetical protein
METTCGEDFGGRRQQVFASLLASSLGGEGPKVALKRGFTARIRHSYSVDEKAWVY